MIVAAGLGLGGGGSLVARGLTIRTLVFVVPPNTVEVVQSGTALTAAQAAAVATAVGIAPGAVMGVEVLGTGADVAFAATGVEVGQTGVTVAVTFVADDDAVATADDASVAQSGVEA